MVTPEWVSKELFQNALRQHIGNNSIKILGFTSSAAVPAGDNYASDLFRTCVTYENEQDESKTTISLIVKCSPEDRQQMQELLEKLECFEKEAAIFQKTLPAIYDILGEYWTLSAKFIYFTSKLHTVLILEDLAPLGFKMYDRRQGFDLEHCLLIVEKLAQLHASSVILFEKDPSLIANYSKGLFSEAETCSDWIIKGLNSLIQATSAWPGFERYGKKLEAIKEKAPAKGAAASRRKLDGFNVLNHGDAWVNNFMFSYTEEGKLKDCRFVDYQIAVYTSPAIDLHYFWATSPKIEVREQHLDTILDRYYAQILATLTKLQYSLDKVPTRKEFREDWNSRAFYGVVAAVTVLPLVKASSREDASLEELMGGEGADGFRHHVYNNERYRKHMEYLLPFFDNLGALDCY